jgi:ABC-type bacteriocin/lantibiotic exporter with double-glycine peptidase domain
MSKIAQTKASVDRMRKVMDLPGDVIPPHDLTLIPDNLRVSEVSFSYGDEPVLKNVCLNIHKSEIVGIMGESGSGKTTLSKIIMGLYEPGNGQVELLSREGIQINDVLNNVAYVPSDNFLFSTSAAENICMNEPYDKARLEYAAKAANIYDHISSLPNGFDEQIGEGSNALSSGQAQRIGIARAIYKNSNILIFDEPTASLDSDNIMDILNTIKQVSKDKICILITHDELAMSICDRVIAIKDGFAHEISVRPVPVL